MKQRPDLDVMEQHIRKMADSLEPPSSLSPENLLQKLPKQQPVRHISLIKKYTPAAAAAACLLVVMTAVAVLRTFTGPSVIPVESSVKTSSEQSQLPPESSVPAEPSDPAESSVPESSEQESGIPIESQTESSQPADVPPENPESSETSSETPQPDPEPATPEESSESADSAHPELQEHQPLSLYSDIYTAMEEMQRGVLQNGENSNTDSFSSLSRTPLPPVISANVDTGGPTVSNGKIACVIDDTGDDTSILLYQLNGPATKSVMRLYPRFDLPEIPDMHMSYVAVNRLLLSDSTLVISGKAYYWSDHSAERRDITVFSIYDITHPETPEFLSTLCQDGRLAEAYIHNGMLSFVTEYSLPAEKEIQEENPNSFLPYSFEQQSAKAPCRNQILIGEDANAPVYMVLGTIDLSDPYHFADTFCYLGGTDSLYITDDFLCLVRSKQTSGQTILSSFELNSGGITMYGEQSVEGTLLGDLYILPNNRGIAVMVTSEENNPSLYLFTKRLRETGRMQTFAPSGAVSSVSYFDTYAYCLNKSDQPVCIIDFSLMRQPRFIQRSPQHQNPEGQISFGSSILSAEYQYDESDSITGVLIKMSRVLENGSSKLLHTEEIPGNINMWEKENVFTDPRSGLIGFVITEYDEENNAKNFYMLYRYSYVKGFQPIIRLPLSEEALYSSFPVSGTASRQYFYVFFQNKVMVLDSINGTFLKEITAK